MKNKDQAYLEASLSSFTEEQLLQEVYRRKDEQRASECPSDLHRDEGWCEFCGTISLPRLI